jgi:hypothetical protein
MVLFLWRCGSALVSVRIRIQLFTSIRIRLQGAKPMQIRRHKKLNFNMKNLLYVGNKS